ncbi:unnamed protein product [Cuscuta campestris]|uniref:Uncharacterized protein n=1 Tax=Cuscuta campestris TaxID=132261 RepID=A0A484N101_9ASTE|nr:unnamed protein product [Cuscuta campestris]
MLTLSKQITLLLTQFPSKPHRSPCLPFTLATIKAGASGDDPSPRAPSPVGMRFRTGPRKRRQMQQEVGSGDGEAAMRAKTPPPAKDRESMSLGEKVAEIYVGEKGVLFWLNKFAYASIYIVIGAWIVFRFVGPALNLYQLEVPPLAPESMIKGS